MLLLVLSCLLLGLLLSGFYSGMETGYYSLNKLRLALGADERKGSCLRVQGHLVASTWLLTVVLVGNNIANYLTTWLSKGFLVLALGDLSETLVVVLNTALLTPTLFILGEVAPKALFRARAESLVRRLAWGITLSGWVLWPLVVLLQWPAAVATRLTRGGGVLSPMAGTEGLKVLLGGGAVEEAGATGAISRVQEELAGKVMDLHRVKVQDVMIRLRSVTVLPEDMDRDAFLARARDRSYLRFPVHRTGRATEVIGYVYLLDLLYDPAPGARVRDHLRRLETLPLDMPADQALVLLQRRGTRLALVTGPEQAPVGVITVTDLVERITGALPERRQAGNPAKM